MHVAIRIKNNKNNVVRITNNPFSKESKMQVSTNISAATLTPQPEFLTTTLMGDFATTYALENGFVRFTADRSTSLDGFADAVTVTRYSDDTGEWEEMDFSELSAEQQRSVADEWHTIVNIPAGE